MNAIREDDDDVLARLEARIEAVARLVSSLTREKAEFDARLRALEAERDNAVEEARAAQEEAARLREENEQLRTRQKEAFARIKALLAQVEQMELPEA
ncbi:MAG: hypothetical protein ACP5UT_08380 [Bryobacteraceae bacterium]